MEKKQARKKIYIEMADVSITNHHRHHRILMFSLIERGRERKNFFQTPSTIMMNKKKEKKSFVQNFETEKKLNETFSQILVDNFFLFFFILVQTNTEFFFLVRLFIESQDALYINEAQGF